MPNGAPVAGIHAGRLAARHDVSRLRLPLWLLGGATFVVPILICSMPSSPVRTSMGEWSLDPLLPWLPARQQIGPEIAIVDLDEAALDALFNRTETRGELTFEFVSLAI
ncbi:MAG: hypothetical protein JOZ05_20210 [Acetobacteraceae bacterium]|nr:hypothetical protein [Acetobacteraceae bacterium]